MTRLSISRAWDETKEVLRRDGSLIATVALALMVLPGTIAGLAQPVVPAGQMPNPGWWTVLQFAALLIGVVAQLAIARIALGNRQSVGQAITHAVRRTPSFLGAAMLWVLPALIAFAPIVQRVQASLPNPPAVGVSLAFLALVAVTLFFFVRLILATPVASAEPLGPIGILKRSWVMTRGNWWRLFGFFILFLFAGWIVMTAILSVIGVAVGLADGPPEPLSVGALLLSLTAQLITAVLTVVFTVMLTRIYAGGTEPASVPHAP